MDSVTQFMSQVFSLTITHGIIKSLREGQLNRLNSVLTICELCYSRICIYRGSNKLVEPTTGTFTSTPVNRNLIQKSNLSITLFLLFEINHVWIEMLYMEGKSSKVQNNLIRLIVEFISIPSTQKYLNACTIVKGKATNSMQLQ